MATTQQAAGVAGAAAPAVATAFRANTQRTVVVDLSGNVWCTYEPNGGVAGELVELVGLATPVYRPLTPGKAGTRP